jgi:hypothetical protein
MTEKNNENAGLTYVKLETLAHGTVKGYGYCSWGQARDGRWYSINYYKNHPMNDRGFNAEVRWEILPENYDVFNLTS